MNHVGVRIGGSAFERDVGPIRAVSPFKAPRGRRGERRTKEAPALKEWMLVEEPRLGLRKVLFRVANDGLPQPRLIEALRSLTGLAQIIETSYDREILAVAVVRTDGEARDLRSRVEELAPDRGVRMDLIETESHEPAARTWLEIARREATHPLPEA
jgi:hypothetical protein